MLNFSVLETKIEISPLFFSVLTAFLILDRNGIALWVLTFSFTHELFHFFALFLCRKMPEKISFSASGIRMELPNGMTKTEKIAVLSAGFLSNFFLAVLLFSLKNTVFGFINLFLGIFTALPLPSTDGGSVLKELFSQHITIVLSRIFGTVVLLILFALTIQTKNLYFLLPLFYLLFTLLNY